MTDRLKKPFKILVFSLFSLLAIQPLARAAGIGVAAFGVNGPKDLQYLSGAAQDAVVGALIKKGLSAHAIGQVLDPDKLRSVAQGKADDALVVTGRVNIVGQTYRVLLKWVDANGQVSQDYLEVADLNQLLPRLEGFASSRLQAPTTAVSAAPAPAPIPVAPEPRKKDNPPKVFKPEAEAAFAPAPKVEAPKVAKAEKPTRADKSQVPGAATKVSEKVENADVLHDYAGVSQRLPYEVRALAYGDVDGDGNPEVLLTDQSVLYVYRQNGSDLVETAKYPGKKLDHFVKVDLMTAPDGGKPWIVLTNLRGSLAASKILRFEGNALVPVMEDIPYMLRVMNHNGSQRLLGQAYRGDASRYPTYEMKVAGQKLETGEKLGIPTEIGLYNFDYLPDGNSTGFALAGLTPSGRLKLFKEDKGKLKSTWTSRESYGGSANDVEVDVQNTFNEVVSDYYIVPLRVQALANGGNPELVVAKNDALLKDIIGRKPVISDGRMVKLKWDPLGMEESWSSKKVDGSILDYLVTSGPGSQKLMVAVRMRDQGFWEGMGKKDSVLLMYDLN